MHTFMGLDVLNSSTSIRLKNSKVLKGINGVSYYLHQLGLSSFNRYKVIGTIKDDGDFACNERREQKLLEGIQKKQVLLNQDGIIEFCDLNQRPVLQMQMKNNRKGFLWHENQMELEVSVDDQVLGKVIHSEPKKDTFTIEDFSGPNIFYDIVQSQDEKCGIYRTYSIYSSTSLPTSLQPFVLVAEITQEDETTTVMKFKDSEAAQSLSAQGRALLLGLMMFIMTIAPKRLREQIHNEAEYKASTLLLY